MRKDGVLVKKKVFALNREIKVNFKDLFKALTKSFIDLKEGNITKLPGDIIDALYSVNLDLNSPTIAWLLIFRSLNRGIYSLVNDNQDLFRSKYQNFDAIADLIEFSLEDTEITIDRSFFNHPQDLSILKEIAKPFQQWLQLYGLNEAQAKSIGDRLPSYFVFALNDEWRDRTPEYQQLHQYLITPFSQVGDKEESWLRYQAWLQKQVDEPMFLEAFSLRQVYVEPRAYFKQEILSNLDQDYESRGRVTKEYKKVVVDLETNLATWLQTANKNDAIRIISGDPGSGKSSFSKMFAARQVAQRSIRVLFIPLHHFDPTGDLVEAVGRFTRDDDYLSHNLLTGELKESRLLIIFDGLDELSMQGKLGAEVARGFINEVQKTVSRINQRQIHLQVIISGRPISISSNLGEVRKVEQILHVLPYFIPEDKRNSYQDQDKLLTEDRRNLWWQKYSKVTGANYSQMPGELNLDNLLEITTQPLLNYLIALSYARSKDPQIDLENKVVFSEDTNLNAIYQDLLKSVYDRGWDTEQHTTLKSIEYSQFVRILEEIALAAWHGNGRTTTVKEIESHCDSSGLKNLLKIFTEGAKSGVTNLLTAFYFRQSGYSNEGDRTFEFTHKSFGEYLTARRIVRELIKINKQLKNREDDPDEGWDEKQALTKWIMLCDMSAIDEYLFDFICSEVSLREIEDVKEWQQTLAHLISYMLRQGMPMERIDPRPSYKEECRQSRNAEEALLAVLNACARYTEEISNIKWESRYSFGEWLSRLQNQVRNEDKIIVHRCLTWLNLEEANLIRAILDGAILEGAILDGAILDGAILKRANLEGAILIRANLREAILKRANLREAILDRANLREANLREAILDRANLREANLREAILKRANLREANLKRANLEGANLEGAILEGANLKRANLEGAILEGANLEGANLEGAILYGANLKRANFEGAILEGANLEGAILKRANFEGAILDQELRRKLKSPKGLASRPTRRTDEHR